MEEQSSFYSFSPAAQRELISLEVPRLRPLALLVRSQRRDRPQGHSAAGRVLSMKNSNETIENRSRDRSGL
jgi:hypothetical protein